MKAIELLDKVNQKGTAQNEYSIYLNFSDNQLCKLQNEDISSLCKDLLLGNDGVILHIDHANIREIKNLVMVYPTIEDGELCHDFYPTTEQPVIIGMLSNHQLVHIYELE